MLTKRTSKNQIMKSVTEANVLRKGREKIRRLGISEEQVKEAIRWARKQRRKRS